jgi:predicted DNA-binding transcriptional regulator AlpA
MTTDSPTSDDRLISSRDAERMLGFASGFLAKKRVQGFGLPYVKLGSRAVRYRLSDIESFIGANKRHSTSEAA